MLRGKSKYGERPVLARESLCKKRVGGVLEKVSLIQAWNITYFTEDFVLCFFSLERKITS